MTHQTSSERRDEFADRHIDLSDADQAKMLAEIAYAGIDELIDGPLVRSSYRADRLYRQARQAASAAGGER
jgi:lipoate synthase